MSFISCSFLFLFFITLLARLTIGRKKDEKGYLFFLLGASLVFYGSFKPSYLLLLLGVTVVDYFMGGKIGETPNPLAKKLFLLVSLLSSLGLLAFYKYSNFLLDNSRALLQELGIRAGENTHMDLVLPLGISFFTFQSMSYTIDIYRGTLLPERRYWRFLLFVSFFTHLISGPIVRASELIYQFDRRRKPRLQVSLSGIRLMVYGFFLKTVVADNIAFYVNRYWEREFIRSGSAPFSLGLALLFACQIFADFEGYTSIARGSAYLLGFRLPVNFNYPYIAGSFREFWNRWHITLSHWMRDYLYIPLGGNQVTPKRLYLNLLLVMVLAGLWHGAAYTFLVWGAIHGTALVVERIMGFHGRTKPSAFVKGLWFLLVQTVILISWIFFRADNLDQALDMVGNLFSGRWSLETLSPLLPGLAFVLPIGLIHFRGYFAEKGWVPAPKPVEQAAWCAIMLYCVFSLYGGGREFLYFQF